MFAALLIMASKQIQKGRNSRVDTTAAAVDPFASVAEESVAGAPAEKPARRVKVLKPAEAVAKAAPKPTSTAKPSKKTSPAPGLNAFADFATGNDEEEVKLEIPAIRRSSNKRKTQIRNSAAAVVPAEAPQPSEKRATSAKRIVEKAAEAPILGTSPVALADIETLPEITVETAVGQPDVELSPVFKKLAEVKLPELPRENRARLLMQSPTRLYFYWSLKQDPWQQLRAVFGSDLGSYTLVVKLRNLTRETEDIHPIESQREWWFNDAEPDSRYMAEIGFYAVNRSYFRVLYSNTISTPRRSPSTHPATEARWTVSATKFAEVLDASGFTTDAVDVAIAGDGHLDAEQRTKLALSDLIAGAEYSTQGIAAEDMRHAIIALAGGATLENLRHRVSAPLFNVLQENADRLSPSGARKALTEHFDVDEAEWTEHEFGPAVFGASLINFPNMLRSRKDTTYSPRYNPVSSFTLGR
jgi:hypothetical protein